MTPTRRLLSTLLCLSPLLVTHDALAASDYPSKPITFIVPFAAGGPTDAVARSLAEAMRAPLHQTIVVENIGGAGGTIAATRVAAAPNDGYTLLLAHVGLTTTPALYAKLRYDPVKDFAPIGMVADLPMLLIARQDLPASNFREFVQYARSHAGNASMANAGVGSATHLCGLLLANALGVEFQPIPYKGIGPAMNDLLGKRVDSMCVSGYTPGLAVKTFAVTGKARMAELPNVPTMQEEGLKNFEVGVWHALWAPKGTPKAVIDRLTAAMQAGIADPAFRRRMKEMGTVVTDDQANPAALEKQVQLDTVRWAEMLRKAGVKPE